jgi:hypothetical protein
MNINMNMNMNMNENMTWTLGCSYFVFFYIFHESHPLVVVLGPTEVGKWRKKIKLTWPSLAEILLSFSIRVFIGQVQLLIS